MGIDSAEISLTDPGTQYVIRDMGIEKKEKPKVSKFLLFKSLLR